jgi:hypothetical protein
MLFSPSVLFLFKRFTGFLGKDHAAFFCGFCGSTVAIDLSFVFLFAGSNLIMAIFLIKLLILKSLASQLVDAVFVERVDIVTHYGQPLLIKGFDLIQFSWS